MVVTSSKLVAMPGSKGPSALPCLPTPLFQTLSSAPQHWGRFPSFEPQMTEFEALDDRLRVEDVGTEQALVPDSPLWAIASDKDIT